MTATRWADRAAALYDRAYARRYRAHDDEYVAGALSTHITDWLTEITSAATRPLDVLDLGCGTGRYFWALRNVRELVGIDASDAMLEEAAAPVHGEHITAASRRLLRGDLMTYEFEAASFDLVYSIGVLAEHVPLDAALVARVARWLRPDGQFAFTTVHPESPSVPRTLKRTIGSAVAAVAPAGVRDAVRIRLLANGRYADEERVRELLAPAFDIETLVTFQSEAHLHCRCLARRRRS